MWLFVPVPFPPEGNGMEWPTYLDVDSSSGTAVRRGDGSARAETGCGGANTAVTGAVAPLLREDTAAEVAEQGIADRTTGRSPLAAGARQALGLGFAPGQSTPLEESVDGFEAARRRGAGFPGPVRV